MNPILNILFVAFTFFSLPRLSFIRVLWIGACPYCMYFFFLRILCVNGCSPLHSSLITTGKFELFFFLYHRRQLTDCNSKPLCTFRLIFLFIYIVEIPCTSFEYCSIFSAAIFVVIFFSFAFCSLIEFMPDDAFPSIQIAAGK